jgi:hypothetical protein
VTAAQAQPQMDPAATHPQALLAALWRARPNVPDLVEVRPYVVVKRRQRVERAHGTARRG